MKTQQQVIQEFVQDGKRGTASGIQAEPNAIYSRVWRSGDRARLPLLVRLDDGGLLANGSDLSWPDSRYQDHILRCLRDKKPSFGVVPFDSIAAAYTDGKVRDWDTVPATVQDLMEDMSIVVPSTGEEWREVKEIDEDGKEETRTVHTLGDSVVRIKNRYYLSAVDETASGSRGSYFLTELLTRRAPASFNEALNLLKPQAVLDAEAQGRYVPRQGEWFAVVSNFTTPQLFADVERGIAVWKRDHILGKDGHHKLEEAVIYKVGPRKGEVYGRGLLTHTNDEHYDIKMGFRWHRIIHNRSGSSYTLRGNFD